jgi:hypothetical protein
MPWQPKWNDFTAGDLVYGLHKVSGSWARSDYLADVFKGGVTIEDFHIINSDNATGQGLSQDCDAFRAMLLEHPKYKSSVDAAGTNETTRRKDKGGLLWASKSGKKVHFVLDGLDMATVVGKTFGGKNPDKPATATAPKNRSITGAELRWIYRNRADKQVEACVQFWFYKKPCCPPWDKYYVLDWSPLTQNADADPLFVAHDGAALWATYVPKVKEKTTG